MYRVVTKSIDHRGRWIREVGPWLDSPDDAENWADLLRHMGYISEVEAMRGHISGSAIGGDDKELHDALSSMA